MAGASPERVAQALGQQEIIIQVGMELSYLHKSLVINNVGFYMSNIVRSYMTIAMTCA